MASWLVTAVETSRAHARRPDAVPAAPVAAGAHSTFDDAVAIVGTGMRLPGGIASLGALWDVLVREQDTVREIPKDRFDVDLYYDADPDAEGTSYVRHASLLDDVAGFDAAFFGISPREAAAMDPQQRILLELAWEALERAGIPPGDLRDSNTGVFVGAEPGEYGRYRPSPATDAYVLTGSLPSFYAGRLSYHLGFQGPALAVDTACSSSLVAVHLACEALRAGRCDLALAAGSRVLADPEAFVALCRARALAPDGRSKAFSVRADGYGRGEGAVVLVLRRLAEARAAGAPILGVIRGTAVNHDGASSGITAPNGTSQQKVLRAALRAARLSPAAIDYIECHGTGTALGDPIEVQAIAAVYGQGRGAAGPIGLGTAKSTIGHLEAASGIAGICRILAALRHEELPATLHSSPRNPDIAWDELAVEVIDRRRPWPLRAGRPRRAGVSSFGLSGTNAHLILEEAPAMASSSSAVQIEPAALATPPVLLSGRTEPALRAQTRRWAAWLADREPALVDLALSSERHRSHLEHRAAFVVDDVAALRDALDCFARGADHPAIVSGAAEPVEARPVFVYSGAGSQWRAMGRILLDTSPAFRARIAECDAVLAPLTGWSVTSVLRGDAPEELAELQHMDVVQPAIFAMNLGLTAAWRALGVEPAAVVGHSQGEVAAAVVAGALELGDAARVICARSAAIRRLARPGGMALLGRSAAEVETLIAGHGDALEIAVVNTPSSTVVSGDLDAVDRLLAELAGRDIFARRIEVDYASHCAHMDPLLPGLARELACIRPRPAQIPLYSTVEGAVVAGEQLDAAYWCRNLRQPVRLDRAMAAMLGAGHRVFVESSAHPILLEALRTTLADHRGIAIGSLRRNAGGADQLVRGLAALHVGGSPVDWSKLHAAGTGRRIEIPTYAFQHETHWLPPRKAGSDAGALGMTAVAHPIVGAATELPGGGRLLTGQLAATSPAWIADHVIHDAIVLPGSGVA
ncbi:MAG TPA: type I polyketide synthase, partial [Kofleriaceae bacterium]